MFDSILNQFQTASGQWAITAQVFALRLFYLLAALEICWFGAKMMFERDNAAEFFSAILVKMLGILFFWVLIQEAPIWLPTITASFLKAGAQVGAAGSSGQIEAVTPSAVFKIGNELAGQVVLSLQLASIWSSPLLLLIAGVTALTVLFCFAIISAQLLLLMVESYLVVSAGVLLLGFLGSSWTSSIGERLLFYVVNIGIRLFFLLLIVGLGLGLTDQWGQLLAVSQGSTLPPIGAYTELLSSVLIFSVVAWTGPTLAAGLITGGTSHSLANSMPSARTLAAAVAVGLMQSRQSGGNGTAGTASQSGSAALREAAKVGTAAAGSKPYGSGFDFPNAKPHTGGLNTISPDPPSPLPWAEGKSKPAGGLL